MYCFNLASLLALAGIAFAADGQFFAYGGGIHGEPLFYGDGTAYLGLLPLSNSSTTNITLTPNSDDGSFTAAPTNNSVSGNWSSPKLFINNNAGSFDAAGFASTSNSSITTTGFRLFGTLLVWVSEAGEIVTKWYAQEIDDGRWVLKWNTDNAVTDDAVPVVLKNLAPKKKR